MMAGCMKMCSGFPLIGIVFGITFLLLGYYLDADVMENKEKQNDEKKFDGGSWDTSCFGRWNMPEAMAKCCEGMKGPGDSRSMMAGCMKMCSGFPLIGIVFGITFLLLGYYLDAEVVRAMWMIFSGCVVILAIFGLIFMKSMRKICC